MQLCKVRKILYRKYSSKNIYLFKNTFHYPTVRLHKAGNKFIHSYMKPVFGRRARAKVHTHHVMDGSDRMQIHNSLTSYDGVQVTLTRLIISDQLKTELWIFEHKKILRCKRNSISKVLKNVFCYYSFSLGFQLMEVTEYLLIDTTDILIKFLPQENKRCSFNKTKKVENSLNSNFFYL